MSINVTVSGNPISIKRGKMVTADPNHAKKEFEKRRLLRLEQVRQQSKDIAEDVRNKVRREKKKQKDEIEEEGKQKLKNWQNRKLLELQTQYKEAIRELGTGYKDAVQLEDESEVLAEQKEQNEVRANQRGRIAATKLQIDKNKESFKKCIPIQHKKMVRDIENTRAALVSSIKKKSEIGECNKKKRKKPSADISITIPDLDSDSEELKDVDLENASVDRLSSIEEEPQASLSSCDCTDDSENPRIPLDLQKDESGSKAHHRESGVQQFEREFEPVPPPSLKLAEKSSNETHFQEKSRNFLPLDTRISDRIKRREIMASQLDYCDTVAQTNPTPFIKSNTLIRETIESRYINNSPTNICTCGKNQTRCSPSCGQGLKESTAKSGKSQSSYSSRRKSTEYTGPDEIPTKPPIKLKQLGDPEGKNAQPSKVTVETTDSQKVQFYDHPNRFSQEKQSTSHVEKITADSLEVIPNVVSEAEWYEKMKQRDREAQMRGQRALEKERIQKDYEDIVKKLPLLQKKERICEINKDKPEYHMSEDRLKEREKKKQNNLDHAYTKLFPNLKPAVVTLPRKKHEPEMKIPDDDEPVQHLNVGKWDVDHKEPKMFTIEEVQEIVKAFTGQKPTDRRAKLKQLLTSLRLQKEQLLSEIRSLPRDESINELINDLDSINDSSRSRGRDGERERKRRHEENEKENSTESSSSSDSKPQRERKPSHRRRHQVENGKTPSPRKKAKIKSKRSVLILQNMSTQTTPKTVCASTSPHLPTPEEQEPPEESRGQVSGKTCAKFHVSCDCNKENEQSTEELCQILIKINDNDEPEVVVKSKETERTIYDETLKTQQKSPSTKKIQSKSIAIGTDELTVITLKEAVPERRPPSKVLPPNEEQPKIETTRRDRTNRAESKGRPAQVDRSDSRAKSWKEHLSKNSTSTTSTSYLSPPEFQRTKDSFAESSRHSLYDLHKKPQQGNIIEVSGLSISQSQSSIGERTIDPTLLAHIKKLLSMSRDSVENLTVSTSNVETPSPSIVEIDSNNPMAQLHNLIKYFNLRAEDIARELSYSPDPSTIHYNSSVSPSESLHPEQEKSSEHAANQSSKSGTSEKASARSVKSSESLMMQYTDVTDSCSKRIASLATMIQQIREEKIEMLRNPPGNIVEDKPKGQSPAGSDIDISTAYLELPESKESSKHSSVNSLDDEELHRRLLEIDLILANKLRKFTSLREDRILEGEGDGREMTDRTTESSDDAINEHRELWMRLKNLMQTGDTHPHAATTSDTSRDNNLPFVPFLSDIPKLPKLEVQPEGPFDSNASCHRRPPPSKGLTVAKKYNGNISLVPHELSTIAEADSQISAKMGSTPGSPNSSKTSQGLSPHKDFEVVTVPESKENEPFSSSKSSKSNVKSPVSCIVCKQKDNCSCRKNIEMDKSKSKSSSCKGGTSSSLSPSADTSKSKISDISLVKSTTAISQKSLLLSSSSSDDLESIEAMLKSIGMEWAIPTLHKTHEALALSSSSSSQDLSKKKQLKGNESTGSEISLREFLSKQMISKISSSTMRSGASPASLSMEFSELSAIQVNPRDEKGKRTSTPITSSKNTSKGSLKRVVFSEESDISSVKDESRNNSEKYSFRSLGEYSHSKNGG